MKDCRKNWWNPLWYLSAVANTILSLIGSILRFLGVDVPQPRMQHENLTKEDVDRAYSEAAAAKALPRSFEPADQRVHEFLRYVNSTAEERAAFDLSDFSPDRQDFMIGLTEDDIELLRRRGPVGQIQAALIGRIPPGLEMKAAPAERSEPSNENFVRESFLSRISRGLVESADSFRPVDFAPAPRR